MTIKVNIPLLAALLLHYAASGLYALSMAYLPPREAVGKATDIAVGVIQVSRENGLEVRFKPTKVLKGSLQTNKLYSINYVDDYMRSTLKPVMEKIAAYAEGKPEVLFLGDLHTDGETLVPNSMDGAVWPRNASAPLVQTPDTLEECITFIKAVMANPKIKLKNVNGRRVLPDDSALPGSAPVSKEETKKTVASAPPTASQTSDNLPGALQPLKKKSGVLWAVGIFAVGALFWLWLKRRAK